MQQRSRRNNAGTHTSWRNERRTHFCHSARSRTICAGEGSRTKDSATSSQMSCVNWIGKNNHAVCKFHGRMMSFDRLSTKCGPFISSLTDSSGENSAPTRRLPSGRERATSSTSCFASSVGPQVSLPLLLQSMSGSGTKFPSVTKWFVGLLLKDKSTGCTSLYSNSSALGTMATGCMRTAVSALNVSQSMLKRPAAERYMTKLKSPRPSRCSRFPNLKSWEWVSHVGSYWCGAAKDSGYSATVSVMLTRTSSK
mmetsp:Transcript_56238/g.157793  ORF Transcript_56238/g.157793 Transcript_56238/m.157793 type:complete len:253 (+) Transcript_56238:1222-1980(+)